MEVSVSALDKVLQFAQPTATPAPDAVDLVRLTSDRLERIAVLLAKKSDPDNDGDDDSNAAGDTDNDFFSKKGKKKRPKKKGKADAEDDDDDDDAKGDEDDDEDVAACRAMVLEAMVALSQVQGGEFISLSVLTMDERRKPSAHTIPGSTDYPIPDKVHLAAAVARYKQGKFAGHSADQVRRHILSRARALGEQVDLAGPTPIETVIALAGGYNGPKYPQGKERLIPMEHGPHTGTHDHPHRVVEVHSHVHHHNGDSRHACGDGNYPSSVY